MIPDYDIDPKTNRHFCTCCNGPVFVDKTYDAFYCEKCNVWLESKCNDPNCEYCKDRPEYPFKHNKIIQTKPEQFEFKF